MGSGRGKGNRWPAAVVVCGGHRTSLDKLPTSHAQREVVDNRALPVEKKATKWS
jgi:hypothetical protein